MKKFNRCFILICIKDISVYSFYDLVRCYKVGFELVGIKF